MVTRRLELAYGSAASLELRAVDERTRAVVRLPVAATPGAALEVRDVG